MRATRWAVSCFTVALGLVAPESAASAFSIVGHKVIEASAYRRLLVDDATGKLHPEGVEIIRALIADGVLSRPPCSTDGFGCEESKRETDPLRWWPVPGTDRPDLVMARQFSKAGQCYHFMASSADEKDSIPGRPSTGLTTDAPNRCVTQLDEIFKYVVTNPSDARSNRMGAYELLHSIADSYSRAHTQRNYRDWSAGSPSDPTIDSLRVWQPTVTFPWENASKATRHEIFEERDDNFIDNFVVVDGRPCSSHVDKPYFVPYQCLSTEGRLAVRALQDALVAIYKTRALSAGKKVSQIDFSAWNAFKAVHFQLAHAPSAKVDLPPEHIPLASLGVVQRYERDGHTDVFDTRGELRGYLSGPFVDPATFMVAASGGIRRLGPSSADRTRVVGRVEAGVAVQLFDRIFVGVTPLAFEVAHSSLLTAYDAIGSLRFEWLVRRNVSVAISSPEYSWNDGHFRDAVTLSAAGVFGLSAGSAAPLESSDEVVATKRTRWQPPETTDVELRSISGAWITQLYVGAAGGLPGRDGQSTTGKLRQGVELAVFKRNAWHERLPLGLVLGTGLNLEFGRGASYPALTLETYASPRIYLIGPVGFAFQAGFDLGNSVDRKPGFFMRPALLASLGSLDITVESPTWVSSRPGWIPEELMGIRMSLEMLSL